ncbi:MAG: hypothetical protein ACI8S6_005836, partial [Myxococcota bacterium]
PEHQDHHHRQRDPDDARYTVSIDTDRWEQRPAVSPPEPDLGYSSLTTLRLSYNGLTDVGARSQRAPTCAGSTPWTWG